MMDYLQTDLPELILAAGQNRALCPLDRSAAQITVGSGLEYLVECLVWRNEEGDKAAISLLAGLALHMPDMALNHARSKNASNGGKGKAAKWAAEDPNAWMRPIFDAAWAELDAECFKRIGHERLRVRAQRIAGPGHPDHYRRDEMGERQARAYVKYRKSLSESPQ
jgi:hypothetical protein